MSFKPDTIIQPNRCLNIDILVLHNKTSYIMIYEQLLAYMHRLTLSYSYIIYKVTCLMHKMFVLTCHSDDNTRQVHDVKIGVVIRSDVGCFPSSFQPPLVVASAASRLITSEIDTRFRFISWVWPSNSRDLRLRNNKHLVWGTLCYVTRACGEECCKDTIRSRYSFNPTLPGRCGSNIIIFKLTTQKSSLSTHCELAFRWMS